MTGAETMAEQLGRGYITHLREITSRLDGSDPKAREMLDQWQSVQVRPGSVAAELPDVVIIGRQGAKVILTPHNPDERLVDIDPFKQRETERLNVLWWQTAQGITKRLEEIVADAGVRLVYATPYGGLASYKVFFADGCQESQDATRQVVVVSHRLADNIKDNVIGVDIAPKRYPYFQL